MSHSKTVVLIRKLMLTSVDITDLPYRVCDELQECLSYQKVDYLRGREAVLAVKQGRSRMVFETRHCFSFATGEDGREYLTFLRGFMPRVSQFLKARGYRVLVEEYGTTLSQEAKKRLTPNWDNLFRFDIKFRPRQDELLALMASREFGRIDCPTGYGKSFMIGCNALIYPQAKIDVVCTESAALQGIYDELVSRIGTVGMVGNKKHTKERVTCYMGQSLHHSDCDADILLVDEVHTMTSSEKIEIMSRYRHAKMFAFSASHEREDRTEFELIGLFGEIIARITYEEAVSMGCVIPLEVHWWNTSEGKSYAEVKESSREKRAIWQNDYRNSVIARAARYYVSQGNQVLVFCKTLEHVVNLQRVLPDFEMVYSPSQKSNETIKKAQRRGLIDPEYLPHTKSSVEEVRKDFRSGKLRGAICTTIWRAGVDFPNLNVVVRADGMQSNVSNTQIPGRAARLGDKESSSIIVCFTDGFNTTYANRAAKSRKDYRGKKWKQFLVEESAEGRKFRELPQ